jgi:uncharacterized membrane protein YhaH (DUF805 family)
LNKSPISSLIDIFINDFIKNLFNFRGISPRGAYLLVNLVLSILYIAGQFLLSSSVMPIFGKIIGLAYVPMTIRRFRDTGKSFWHLLWIFLPIIGWTYLLYLLFFKHCSTPTSYSQQQLTHDGFAFNASLVGITILTAGFIYFPTYLGMEENEAPVASVFKYLHENPDSTKVLEYFTDTSPQPIIDLLWAQTQFYAPVKSSFFNPTNGLKMLTNMHYSQELLYSPFIDEMYIMTTLPYLPQNTKVKNPVFNNSESKKYYNILNSTYASTDIERLELAQNLLLIYSHQHIYDLFEGYYQHLPPQIP